MKRRNMNSSAVGPLLLGAIFVLRLLQIQAAPQPTGQRVLPSEFELLDISSDELDQHFSGESTWGFDFVAFGKQFSIELQPGKLFSPGAQVVWLLGDGSITYREPAETTILSGGIRGEKGSLVRLVRLSSGLEGVIVSQQGIFFLEPASRYLPALAKEQTLAYRLDAMQPFGKFPACGASHIDAVQSLLGALPGDLERIAPSESEPALAGELREVELRLIVDHYYFELHGLDSVDRVHGLIHEVNGIFERELGLTFRISETLVATSSSADPLGPATNAEALLQQLADLGLQGAADLAHLFTARELDGETLGISWMGSICSPPYAVGLTQDQPSGGARVVATAHELAHAIGARHDGVGYCSSTRRGFIMWPILDPDARTFSECTTRLARLTLANAGCVAPLSEEPLPPPEPMAPVGEVPTSSIELEWDRVQGAVDYVVEIRKQSDSAVHEESTRETRLLPQMYFQSGTVYAWRVTARDSAGLLGERSGWTEFTSLSSRHWKTRVSTSWHPSGRN